MYQKILHFVQEFVFLRSPGVALVRGASVLLQLLFVSLVTRYSGTATAGDFFSTYAAVLIASSVTRLGVEHFFVANLPRMTEIDRSQRIVTFSLNICIATALFFLASQLVQFIFGWNIPGNAAIDPLLFWASVLLLSLNWANVGVIRGMGRYLPSVSLETLVYTTVFLIALIALARVGEMNDARLSLILAASIGFSSLCGGIMVSRTGVRLQLPRAADIKRTLLESTPFWLASALSVANVWLPILLLGQLAPPEEVSTFLLGQRLAASILFGLTILNARYARDYAHLMSANQIAELGALYRRNTVAQLPFVFAVGILLLVIAPYIIDFSGVTHRDAYQILLVLCLGTIASAMSGPIVTASLATGNADLISIVMASTISAGVAAILLLGTNINGLSLAIIVATMMAAQNLSMYVWWKVRMKGLCT